ncbi:phosphoglucosamine mutase [Clostridium acetireducens DSM 10703]|uniref:Phosphoglucosamine mutase n=1 Tax=Clostridium acetireducens DSM 10703 TaxID=1121290 RepID=A0A1E8F0K5_9CLOT|nr:phosphoglucosamine mutase [Clostridium acetireducens]OFI06835.1 phosphoglucosamine mutase [Clostridium acetireducens DSM 10703]
MGRMFGTDGVRGVANKELTVDIAYKLGRAGAYVLTNKANKPKILVGMDTRVSGDMLENALVAGILSVGAEAVCIGVVPTPAVAYLTRKYGADAGVVISASHNPVEYNGIKFFNSQGYKLSDELEDEIQYIIENKFHSLPSPIGEELGRRTIEERAERDYINFAKSTIDVDLKGLKIALDCANGAAYKTSVNAFKELGAEVLVINNNPNGFNINKNAGSTHPESLINFIIEKGCDFGFAFDGDADRCIAVDEKGNIINGDYIMTICSKYLKDNNKLDKNTLVVTVMSNMGLYIALEKEKINISKTKVGDRYVLEEMIKKGYKIGGEQSGHIIFLDYNTTGDGLITALQLAAIVKKNNKKLSELASIMKELPQVLINAKVPNDKKDIYITDKEISQKIEQAEKALNGKGRVLIRPSGTEPLVRVMLEGENQSEITDIAKDIASLIEKKCNF